MRTIRFATLSVAIALAACGDSAPEGEKAAAAPAGPHATAVTRHFAVSMNKLEVEEHKYVDGFAVRFEGGAAAVLTEAPLDACTKLAVAASGTSDFGALGQDQKPALVVIRDAEHPEGAILAVQPGMTQTLEEKVPGFKTDGSTLVFKGDIGDAGWGQIDATKYGGTNSPHASLDIDLPYTTMPATDPAADASEEAKWLHDLRKKVEGATDMALMQADVEAAVQAAEYDYFSSRNFFQLLSNWKDPKVTSVTRGPDCATLIIGAMSFTDAPVQAIVHTRMIGGQRKAVSVATLGDD